MGRRQEIRSKGQVVVALRGSTQCCDRWWGYRLVSRCTVLTVQQYRCWGEGREVHGDVRGRGLPCSVVKRRQMQGPCQSALLDSSQLSVGLAYSFSGCPYTLH